MHLEPVSGADAGRNITMAVLLFALVVAALLGAAAILVMAMARRRVRNLERVSKRASARGDAWSVAGQRPVKELDDDEAAA